MSDPLQLLRDGAVARLRLDRPQLHNAFDAGLIAELTAALEALGSDASVRVVVLEGAGASFSAGADLNWMRGMAAASEADNREDSLRLARLMRTLDELPKPTIARVHGAAFGGGVGLVACCDIAIGVDGREVRPHRSKLGLLPAVISPYVIAAIGARQARRWFATAEIFDADEAQRIGLLHHVVDPTRRSTPPCSARSICCCKAGPVAAARRQGARASHCAGARRRRPRCRQRRPDRAAARLGRRPGRPRRLPRQAQARLVRLRKRE